ncbi:MAG TPA: NADPH:quinone oxidoreductase family protein [Xanthobacteraceae bacterium]|jgi:NADPH2:quinone reductase|nr:NADPH:quinone oxidoreductase family protein [Xanthobacteraceae bacterium]
MKAVLCTRFGGPDDLELHDIPDPVPGPEDVVVEIEAAALNFYDTLIIAGRYQTKPPFPFSPSGEFAGTVSQVGANVGEFTPGDRVAGYIGYGAARERVAAPASKLVKLPPGLEAERASGIIITYGTTLHALRDRAKLRPGETLAVLGASGGVGLAAVEIGKIMGARVIACASSPEKLEFAREHGADATIDYSAADLKTALREATGGQGPDVIYDPIGGPYTEAALRAIAWHGRFLVVGFATGEIPKLPLNLVLLKECDVCGVYFGAWSRQEPETHRQGMADLMRWCAEGRLSAHVHARYPLEQTSAALRAIAERKVMGKVILQP